MWRAVRAATWVELRRIPIALDQARERIWAAAGVKADRRVDRELRCHAGHRALRQASRGAHLQAGLRVLPARRVGRLGSKNRSRRCCTSLPASPTTPGAPPAHRHHLALGARPQPGPSPGFAWPCPAPERPPGPAPRQTNTRRDNPPQPTPAWPRHALAPAPPGRHDRDRPSQTHKANPKARHIFEARAELAKHAGAHARP